MQALTTDKCPFIIAPFHSATEFSNFDPVLARKWLSYCNESHPECSWDQNRGLPRRVLDVLYQGQSMIRLHNALDGEEAEYAALSYCWGHLYQHVTTASTLTAHHGGIHTEALPQTLRYAVQVTRDLGLKYL
jgi:hypothetical protein